MKYNNETVIDNDKNSIGSKLKNLLKKVLKRLPIIKQLNRRYWDLRNILNENTNVLYENTNVLYENTNVLYENTNVLHENRNILNENNTILKNIQYLNHEITYKLNALLKISNKQTDVELSFLCDLYGSDKGSMFRNVHTYAKVYQTIFSPIRNKVKAVLQCGIGKNNPSIPSNLCIYPNPYASLSVWRDYFTNAIIIGGDINAENLFDDDRIHAAYLDQLSPLVIKRFFKYFVSKYTDTFDIIIDDGLNTFEAAVCLFENSFQYLAIGGLYIIEDMHTVKDIPLFKDFFDTCNVKDQITVRYELLEKISLANDNNLIIITKLE